MTVRFIPGTRKQKTTLIQGFLSQFKVAHELVQPNDVTGHSIHLGTNPVVEVDGKQFVDPNVDALKKIFHVN